MIDWVNYFIRVNDSFTISNGCRGWRRGKIFLQLTWSEIFHTWPLQLNIWFTYNSTGVHVYANNSKKIIVNRIEQQMTSRSQVSHASLVQFCSFFSFSLYRDVFLIKVQARSRRQEKEKKEEKEEEEGEEKKQLHQLINQFCFLSICVHYWAHRFGEREKSERRERKEYCWPPYVKSTLFYEVPLNTLCEEWNDSCEMCLCRRKEKKSLTHHRWTNVHPVLFHLSGCLCFFSFLLLLKNESQFVRWTTVIEILTFTVTFIFFWMSSLFDLLYQGSIHVTNKVKSYKNTLDAWVSKWLCQFTWFSCPLSPDPSAPCWCIGRLLRAFLFPLPTNGQSHRAV